MAWLILFLTRQEPHLKGARGLLAAPGWRLDVVLGQGGGASGLAWVLVQFGADAMILIGIQPRGELP